MTFLEFNNFTMTCWCLKIRQQWGVDNKIKKDFSHENTTRNKVSIVLVTISQKNKIEILH